MVEPDPDRSSEHPAPEPDDEARRLPRTIGGMFYLLVLGTVAVAMVVVAFGEWRPGIRLMGGALIFAAIVRLVLRSRDAGMLAVRHKALDAVILAGLGAALIFLAGSIPDQPGF
jgi:multisubunit Na+/H+ antiporter MnhB subunit